MMMKCINHHAAYDNRLPEGNVMSVDKKLTQKVLAAARVHPLTLKRSKRD
jgi:hypothetical protein